MRFIHYIIFSLLFITPAYATILHCPTVADIKNHQLNGWLPLYENNEELASQADTEKFIQSVTQFAAAWWQPLYLEAGHCTYTGSDPSRHIILAHDAWRPTPSSHWQWISANKLAVCRTDNLAPSDCGFIT